jgi:tyrosyl-tRNA synthetase
MALAVTASRHGEAAALEAQTNAGRMVMAPGASWQASMEWRGGGAAVEGVADSESAIPELSLAAVNFPAKAFYLVGAVGIGVTSSEAKRRIQEGGVRLDGEKLLDPNQVFASPADLDGKVLQLGKKTFRRLMAE